MDRLVGDQDRSEIFNRVVCIRNEFSKEDINERVSERAEIVVPWGLTGAGRTT